MTTAESTVRKYPSKGWDLGELLPDPGEKTLEARLAELEEAVGRFERHRSGLDDLDSAGLLGVVRDYEGVAERMHVLAAYGSLWFSSDTQSEAALAFRSRVEQALTKAQNRILFFTVWWKGVEDDRAERLLDGCEDGDGAFFLSELRRFRAFSLDEESEQLINLKDADGVRGLLTVYSMLTNRLTFEVKDGEEEASLTRDELMAWVLSSEASKREAAYREFFRVFSKEAKILGQIYVHRVRDWHNENVGLRGYESPLAVRNVANDVPGVAVETLIESARANRSLFHRFFRLKAKWLGGGDRLHRFDLYAPLTGSRRQVDYSWAVSSVLDVFADFDEGFAAAAERVFREDHIDSEVRPGKRSGAFCATVTPRLTPWVMLNFTGRMRDVATMAHELGHAVHSMLAEHHSLLTQHASLPLAETASVFSEMLMTDHLLAHESDPLARRELLSTAVDDIYATVLRQSYFVLFEKAAHEAILEGAALEQLNDVYLEQLREQFGDAVVLPEAFREEWVSIPHIYSTPFYCYSYSFGQLLVLSLYSRYRQDPEAFKPGYLQLLAYGGSARPETVLNEAGVDISDAAFWQGGFDLVGDLVDQMEELALDPG